MRTSGLLLPFGVAALCFAGPAYAGTVTTFDPGAMVVPMDATYQDDGILDAYGLVYALLREGIQVNWIVDSTKAYDGYDLVDVSTYLSTESASAASARSFAGGPFVVEAAYVAEAQVVLDAWQAAGWSAVAYYTTDTEDMEVSRTMFVAPSIAIFEDGNEDIAWDYLNAAGIPDFDGNEWDASSPYNLSEEDVVGASDVVAGDGALFDDEGYPAYCHLNAMHWDDTSAEDVVMEVRAFATDQLTSSLFECVAGESMENDATYGSMISTGIAKVGLDRGDATYTVDDPEAELLQLVGEWGAEGGSLPDFTGTLVAGAVTLTGVDDDGKTAYVVASGRLDGDATQGKVSILGAHSYDATQPYSRNAGANGVRVFLNSYFTADCDNLALAPDVAISGTPVATDADVTLTLDVSNGGVGRARYTTLTLTVPAGLAYVSDSAGGVYDAATNTVTWDLTTLDSGETDSIDLVFVAAGDGTYTLSAEAVYYVEATDFSATWSGSVDVVIDTDDDGLSDADEGTLGSDPTLPDTDGDGLDDSDEVDIGTDPLDADTDDDALDDGTEVNDTGTDPLDADSDDDALDDGAEVNDEGTDPLDDDSDDDGLGDGTEVTGTGTDPLDADTDDGGVSDGTEVGVGTDPLDPSDDAAAASVDSDGDGVPDVDETAAGTDPTSPDSDGDGLDDGAESTAGTDPLDADSDDDGLDDETEADVTLTDPLDADTDDDGLGDGTEVNDTSTDPLDADSDDDALDDGTEVNDTSTDPNDADTDDGGTPDGTEVLVDDTDPLDPSDDVPDATDTDGDGLTDRDEEARGTDPLDADSDDDGLDDGTEATGTGTDPLDADTDDGGVGDGDEVAAGTDPLDPSDDQGGGDTGGDPGDDTGIPGDTGTPDDVDTGGPPDTGAPGDELGIDDEKGNYLGGSCGCGAPGADPAAAAALLAGLALAARRRGR